MNSNITFWVKYETFFCEATWVTLLTLVYFSYNCWSVITLLVIVAMLCIDMHESIWVLSFIYTDEFDCVSVSCWVMMHAMSLRSLCCYIAYVDRVCRLRTRKYFKLRVFMCHQNTIFLCLKLKFLYVLKVMLVSLICFYVYFQDLKNKDDFWPSCTVCKFLWIYESLYGPWFKVCFVGQI